MAIHDTSSVVGAAKTYSNEALAIATTTKLIRALWIISVSLIARLLLIIKEQTPNQKYPFLTLFSSTL